MKRLKMILKAFATLFLILLVSLCIYTFVVTDIMKKDYVNVFGYTYFVVATGSMSGTIEVDDIIFVKLTDKVEVDDVITFKSKDGDIITHRLIKKDGSRYVTKGDVNNVVDEAITKDQIIGRVDFVISPSFILKSIAVFLIIFILLALVNFDSVVKKYIVKGDPKETPKIPEELFSSNATIQEDHSGLTVTIRLEDVEQLEKIQEKEAEQSEMETVELLDEESFSFLPKKKKATYFKEKETVDLVVAILKCKKNTVKAKMNKKWLTKFQYVYRLCHLLLLKNTDAMIEDINHPPFKELYDYNVDSVGLTETIRDRIFEMPISVFLRILTYCILYNDEEMFDGVYKILKFKVLFDKNNDFREIKSVDMHTIKQIKSLIQFMKKVSERFDNKNVFELDKIERLAKINNY